MLPFKKGEQIKIVTYREKRDEEERLRLRLRALGSGL